MRFLRGVLYMRGGDRQRDLDNDQSTSIWTAEILSIQQLVTF